MSYPQANTPNRAVNLLESGPIWISLADLQGKTLEEYLLQRWLKNALEVARVTPEQENALVELFKKERVWLFLDGVDEMAGDSVSVGARHVVPLQMIASQLEGWVAKARVVLSCRLNVWEANINALGDDFETYRLLDFDYPLQVKEFICRWFRKTDTDKGERLWAELDKSERQRIQDLVKNPLRLALLCSTWQSSDKGLPSTKAGLYERFVEVLYTWKKNRFPTTFEQRQELNAALGRLALRAIDSEESRFRLRHKLVCDILGDPEQEGSLFGLALQLGWLNKVGLAAESETEEKVYAFFHPTFQEYFAALAIDDWHFFLNHVPHNPTQGNYRIFEPQWKEVILLWLGREEVEREPFIQALVEFKDGCGNFYRYKAYFLAAEGIAEFHNCSQADDIVEQIVKWGFGYFNIKKQTWQKFPEIIAGEANLAILATNPIKSIKTLGELIQICQDEYIRLTVISTLEEIDKYNSQIINSLVDLIQTSQNEDVCWIAAEKLIEVGKANPLAITALIELSNTFQDEIIRQIAANMLGEAGENTVSIQSLFEALQIPLDKSNRWELVDGLGEIHKDNPLVINALIELIQPWQDEDTRLKALDLLGKIDKFNSLLITNLIEIIQTSQNEDNPDRAAYVLQRIGEYNPLVITALVELIQTSQDENTRLTAASTLEGIDEYNPLAITTLVELIQTSQDEGIYSIAAGILGEIVSSARMEGIVTALRGCVSDEAYENEFQRYCDCYEVIWLCAENMTYPAFYHAWHPREGVGKTTTPSRQSLKQADFPQSLQSAIANDPQLSQTIHVICIDGSQFIEPDRPAAEIYDQMLDQNCPECNPVPETMPALKLYWNSLRRNSDKRPVLVFYASSTEPYSAAFLTDLSKFSGAICVVTSPPAPLLAGEGSKSSSGSPSSPWGEGVRGWGSLQFFTPSQPIADVTKWIRAIAFS